MAIKINGTTVIDDSRNVQNLGGFKTVGGQSLIGSGDIEASTKYLDKPTITSPTNGQTSFAGTFTISGLSIPAGAQNKFNGTQDYVEWELSTSSTFATLADYYYGTSNLTSWNSAQDNLTPITTYYVRVRVGSNKFLSEWSDTVSYTTPNTYVAVPSITSPANGFSDQDAAVTASSSAFSVFNGSDTHASSDWQLASDSGFTNILEQSMGNTSNKTSYSFTYTLSTSTTYYLRVRHNGTNLGPSGWSNASSFTTRATFEGNIEYTTSGTYTWVAPAGCTSTAALVVGPGGTGATGYSTEIVGGGGGGCSWGNSIPVSGGSSYTVYIPGASSNTSKPQAYFDSTSVLYAEGGQGANGGQNGSTGGYGGGSYRQGGGNGGSTTAAGGYNVSGGGGAAGYTGNGGNSAYDPGTNGSGGGGGGGAGGHWSAGGGGGGVGLYGQGANGSAAPVQGNANVHTMGCSNQSGGRGGSGGEDGYWGQQGSHGGNFGGGGAGRCNAYFGGRGQGGKGAVRLIWGNHTFPNSAPLL
jgi:hypothetical protein